MKHEITPYEQAYTAKVNSMGFLLLLVHLPILCVVASMTHASIMLTAGIMLLLLLGPALILMQGRSSELGGVVIAVAAMGVSALAIYVCNGLIEAHFELFVLIALLTVYGRVAPLLAAGLTIALHHVFFWLWLPSSIFNYKASIGIVALHAFFVVVEVIPACWIARQFGKSIQAQGIVVEHLGGAAEQIPRLLPRYLLRANHLRKGHLSRLHPLEKHQLLRRRSTRWPTRIRKTRTQPRR